MKLLSSKRGDTIIEVMIAIVIVSGTLGAAFASLNRGVANTRAAQERADSLKLVERQIELLKTANDEGVDVHAWTEAMCLDIDAVTGEVVARPAKSGGGSIDDDHLTEDYSQYTAECKQGGIPGGYNLSITPESDDVFTTRARWFNVNGSSRDQIFIKYRVPE